jgi:signal transduction protein with GAF and PtsI domain
MNSVRENKALSRSNDKKKIQKICGVKKFCYDHRAMNHQLWLEDVLKEFQCQTGTIHRTAPDGQNLSLVFQIGVPEILLDKISYIPFGKGIAGAAAEKREPIELCNLQQDLGGVARPDARKTNVSGSLAVPIFSADSTRVIGVVGVGMMSAHDFTCEEKLRLSQKSIELREEFDTQG